MTGAVVISDDRTPVTLSRYGARRLTDEIRAHLGTALGKLAQARDGHADQALGYATWWEYVETEFGNLSEMRLPTPERRALHASMADSGLSRRQSADKTGFSLGTVQADLVATGRTTIQPLAPAPEPEPIGHLPKTDQVVILVGRQGDRGLTCLEMELETGWRHGVASGPLSRCRRQGRVRGTGRFRGGYEVYVADAG